MIDLLHWLYSQRIHGSPALFHSLLTLDPEVFSTIDPFVSLCHSSVLKDHSLAQENGDRKYDKAFAKFEELDERA